MTSLCTKGNVYSKRDFEGHYIILKYNNIMLWEADLLYSNDPLPQVGLFHVSLFMFHR